MITIVLINLILKAKLFFKRVDKKKYTYFTILLNPKFGNREIRVNIIGKNYLDMVYRGVWEAKPPRVYDLIF